eukprot:gene2694-3343_t
MGNSPSKKDKNQGTTGKKKPEYNNGTSNGTTTNSSSSYNGGGSTSYATSNTTASSQTSSTSVASSNNTNSSQNNHTTTTSGNSNKVSHSTSQNKEDKNKKLEEFFDKYKDPDDPNSIGPDGIVNLCKDLNVDPEDITILVLAWHLNAKQMGFFTKEEFVGGLSKLGIESLPKLQSYLPQFKKELDDSNNFREIYRFAFIYAKENETNKILDLEGACSMLSLVLGNATKYPHTEKLKEFLLSQKSYKVLNMDQWLSILEFSKVILPDVSNYDENGAWPVILDEFVDWVKANPSN